MIVKRSNSVSQHKFDVGDVIRILDSRDEKPRYCMITHIQMMDEYDEDEIDKYGVVLLTNQGKFQGQITTTGFGPSDLAEDLFDSVDELIEGLHKSWKRVEYCENFYGVDDENDE